MNNSPGSEDSSPPDDKRQSISLLADAVYGVLLSLVLISLGAATLFNFFGLLRGGGGAPWLDWLVSAGLALLFGLLPIAAGCWLLFRSLPKPADSGPK